MDAAEIMTSQPVTVSPSMQVRDVARLLLQRRISAVPVVDATGALLGIVSEGDLVRHGDIGRDAEQSWWLQFLAEGENLAPEFIAYVRDGDRRVQDVMTRAVVTVEETTPVTEIARLLQEHRIKRVPVLRAGRLVGIVSRADLIRSLMHAEEPTERPAGPRTLFEMSRPDRDSAPSGSPEAGKPIARDSGKSRG